MRLVRLGSVLLPHAVGLSLYRVACLGVKDKARVPAALLGEQRDRASVTWIIAVATQDMQGVDAAHLHRDPN